MFSLGRQIYKASVDCISMKVPDKQKEIIEYFCQLKKMNGADIVSADLTIEKSFSNFLLETLFSYDESINKTT